MNSAKSPQAPQKSGVSGFFTDDYRRCQHGRLFSHSYIRADSVLCLGRRAPGMNWTVHCGRYSVFLVVGTTTSWESVRKLPVGSHRFRSMRRMEVAGGKRAGRQLSPLPAFRIGRARPGSARRSSAWEATGPFATLRRAFSTRPERIGCSICMSLRPEAKRSLSA